MKKKLSMALVCAVLITILLMGTALAAVLGVFGRMKASPYDAQKLAHLDEAAVAMDVTVPLKAPISETAVPALTTYDEILHRQQERRFLDSLYQKRVDALVLSSVDVDDPNVGRYYASGTPVIFLDNLPHIQGEDVH